MPRPDRPLQPDADPIQRLASDLRDLRRQAGNPTYQALARKTQAGPEPRSSTTLSDAAGGQSCPSWTTLAAFVAACGGQPREWHERWQRAQTWRPEAGDPASPEIKIDRSEDAIEDQSEACSDSGPIASDLGNVERIPSTDQASDGFLASDEPDQNAPQTRSGRRVLLGVGALVGGLALGVAGVALYLGPTRVTGTVTCASGDAVVGIWVKAEEGTSGYASYLQRVDPDQADFDYRLSERTRWTVNVGCGGTTQTWLHPVHGVAMTSATDQDWSCNSDRRAYGCRTV